MKHHEPYLPARALGIEEWERDELIALASKLLDESIALDMMRRGLGMRFGRLHRRPHGAGAWNFGSGRASLRTKSGPDQRARCRLSSSPI